jgi:hypothetical protein
VRGEPATPFTSAALDGDPFLHVTHQGEPRFLTAGFEAAGMRDLESLAQEEKASIDRLDGPGGGSVVRLKVFYQSITTSAPHM